MSGASCLFTNWLWKFKNRSTHTMDRKNVCCGSLYNTCWVEFCSSKPLLISNSRNIYFRPSIAPPPSIVQFVLHASTTLWKRWSNLKRVSKLWANERLYQGQKFLCTRVNVFCSIFVKLKLRSNGGSPLHLWRFSLLHFDTSTSCCKKGQKFNHLKCWVRFDQVWSGGR